MPSFCSSSSSVHVAVELDSIFASGKHRESGFNPENGFNPTRRVCSVTRIR